MGSPLADRLVACRPLCLAASCLTVMYAKRLYRFQDTRSMTLLLDHTIPLTFDDIKAWKDRVLEWVQADVERRKQGLRSE
ncbi:hypothetical protein APED_03200 [Acanthopleuribacter pedis]